MLPACFNMQIRFQVIRFGLHRSRSRSACETVVADGNA
jgi:hypothetical protein